MESLLEGPRRPLAAVERDPASSFTAAADQVVAVLSEALPEATVCVTSFDRVEGTHRIVASTGDPGLGLEPGREIPLETAHCFYMATEQSPRHAYRCQEDPNFRAIDPEVEVGSYLGVPLELEDGTRVGSLCAISRRAGAIPATLGPMISVLARTLALALEGEADADRLREANRLLLVQASTDGLTGVSNRRGFVEDLDRSWRLARRGSMGSILFMVDFDGLEALNVSRGEAVGDLVLVELAGALSTVARGSDLVGRLAGDEFAVVLHGCSTPAEADAYSLRFSEELDRRASDLGLEVSVSIGICLLGEAASPEGALELAGRNMYEVKRGRPART